VSWRETVMRAKSILSVAAVIAVFGAVGLALYGWHREIPAVERQDRSAFDAALVVQGAELARIGNCNTCHTRDGGAPYAGGRPMTTPLGTVYATNITPDRETGIGAWSEGAFRRALREGVRRDGAHLYPAFPYDHFTKL
jgi:mono/diheme cytochrome c family protein